MALNQNLVKFVYVPGTVNASQIAAFDANTIYFIAGSHQIYKGTTLFDGGSQAGLELLRQQIGTLPVGEGYTDLIDYIDKQIAAAESAADAAVDALDEALAAVAKSGLAADVSIADADNLITANTVEGALAELASRITNVSAAGEVTMESTSGSGDTLTVYDFYQGVLSGDTAQQKAAKKIGTINIPKDYLVRSATIETADTVNVPYTGAAVGDRYIDFVVNTKDGDTGTPNHMYIPLNDLVAVMQGSVGDEISVTIGANNTITASVESISGDKIIYEVGTGNNADVTVNDKIAALETALGNGISALDADVNADITGDTNAGDAEAVAVVGGITEVDGVITAVDSVAADKAGAATRAKSAVIGQSGDAASVNTIYGAKAYADAAVAALDNDRDAALGAGDTDTEAVAVVTGVTQVDGAITSVDSYAVDKAGAATRAKAAVIGTNADAASANTVYGAKAYADAQVNSALTWGSLASS